MFSPLQSHPRININIGCIHNQVNDHINQRHPEHITLNQVIITGSNGSNGQISKSRIRENYLYNTGTAKKTSDGQTKHRNQRKQCIRKYIFPDDGRTFYTSGFCTDDIVLTQFLQNCCPTCLVYLDAIAMASVSAGKNRLLKSPPEAITGKI